MMRDLAVAERVSFLLGAPMLLSATSISSRAWETGIIHKDFFVIFILSAVLLGLGYFFRRRTGEVASANSGRFSGALGVAGSLYAYVLLWLSLHSALLDDNTAVMIALAIY